MKRQSKSPSRTKSNKEPKLRVKRETVRVLSDDKLEEVVGGNAALMTTWHCMAFE